MSNEIKIEDQEVNDLNNILFTITSSLKIPNPNNIKEQSLNISQLIQSNINNPQVLKIIIQNLAIYIIFNQNNNFNYLDLIFNSLNDEEIRIFLSEILTYLQENISDENIEEIKNAFLNIIKSLHEKRENSEIFKLLNGFCIYNFNQSNINNQEIGIQCFLSLIKFVNFNNNNNDIDLQKIIWENLSDLLENNNFFKKYELLNCLNELILISKNNFEQYAAVALYKILDFLNDENDENKIIALEIIKNLLTYCEKGISSLKEQIINFMEAIEDSKNEKIEEESYNILQLLGVKKIRKKSSLGESHLETENKQKDIFIKKDNDINNKPQKIFSSKENEIKNKYTLNNLNDDDSFKKKNIINNKKKNVKSNQILNNKIPEYDNKIATLISQMKEMSDKQIYLIDIISNLQKSSSEQINLLNEKVSNLESNILKSRVNNNPYEINDNKLNNIIYSGNESLIINYISNINLKEIKNLDVNVIEDILLVIYPILSKGNYIHECISFIKAILMSYNSNCKLRDITLKNINDILLYIKDNNNDIRDEDLIDISLLTSFLKNNKKVIN